MEICKPPLVWVNGNCYRKNPLKEEETVNAANFGTGDVADEYEDEGDCRHTQHGAVDDQDQYEEGEHSHEIEAIDGGRFKAKLHVASAFFAILIGKKGTTKKRLENETRTKISIPKQGVENEDVEVRGDSRSNVASACTRIDLIVSNARQRQGFTHFVSIPVNMPEMQTACNQFTAEALEKCGDARGLEESVFQGPTLLHMTICTLALMDDIERKKAIDILHNICTDELDMKDIKVAIKGLEIMNDDPSEVDVVYAKVNSDRLQTAANAIVEKFRKSGLVAAKQYERVKLHVTLINTLFRKGEDPEGEVGEAKERITLDSRPLFTHFSDRDFATVTLKEVHLSQRRAGKRTKENYYFPSTIVKL